MRRFFIFFVFILLFHVQAEETNDTATTSSQKNYFAAIAGTETSNFLLYLNNRYIGTSEFGHVSLDSIRHNATTYWQWDQSVYWINETGHPYQGSTYFNSGRANGLNFYESGAVTMLGSATWEITCERGDPSVNDLIVTTLGGMSFGEIFHRLYLEAAAHNSPIIAAAVSPVDAIATGISRKKLQSGGGQIRSLRLATGCGYEVAQTASGSYTHDGHTQTPVVSHELTLVYGNPYAHETNTPFTQFDVTAALESGDGWYQLAYFTDGFLYSFAPIDNDTCKSTVGLTLNYDVILGNTNSFGSNALDLSFKQLQRFGKNGECSIKAHAGWLVLGSSQYYLDTDNPYSYENDQLNNYGTGVNAKLDVSIGTPFLGTAALNAAYYYVWIIPNSAPYSDGTEMCARVKASYTHYLRKDLNLGIENIATWNYGWYKKTTDSSKHSNASMLYLEYDLK